MGFYSVVTLTSGALLSCLVTTRSQLTTVTPDTFTVKYEDDYWTTKRLLQADLKIAANSEEERVPELVADFTMQGRRPVNWDVINRMDHPHFSNPSLQPRGDTIKELVEYLVIAFYKTFWYHIVHAKDVEVEELLKILSEHFGDDLLAYVLAKLVHLPIASKYAEKFHYQYLELMIKQGRTPSTVLELWNKDGIPLSSVVENLHEFIKLYNVKEGTKTTAFEILKSVFEDQKKMVQEISGLNHEGGKIESQLHTDMVQFFLNEEKTFDEVFELTKPEAVNEKWSFDTLKKYAELSGWSDKMLLRKLLEKFGGFGKLAPVLAEAEEYDQTAEDLQLEIVHTFLDLKLTDHQALQALDLMEGELTPLNTDTLSMYLERIKPGEEYDIEAIESMRAEFVNRNKSPDDQFRMVPI